MMNGTRKEEIRRHTREVYGRIAKKGSTGCYAPPSTACCGPTSQREDLSKEMGYSSEEIQTAPEGANLGLGCGNPQAVAALKPGEIVVDLGSGAGFDVFLAARRVDDTGLVIGVDMTPEMVSRARENAETGGFRNVSFRLGEIENLPVADDFADVILSNCVINLSVDKERVYQEAFRVLKPGGRLAISDTALTAELPPEHREDLDRWAGCASGAETIAKIRQLVVKAGFEQVKVTPADESRKLIEKWVQGSKLEEYVISVNVEGIKPAKFGGKEGP